MKTNNFNMSLMVPDQINKDVIFNESLLTIDNFLNITINRFIEEIPEDLMINEKFIIKNDAYKNHICYKTHESKAVSYFLPQKGMLFFLLETRNFILYTGTDWEKITLPLIENSSPAPSIEITTSVVDKRFTGIQELFTAPNNKPYLHLYLSDNVNLDFNQVTLPEITIMIKQCYNASKSLIWPDNILWENKSAHKMTKTHNATDIIKLYRLPETTHFLGTVIAQNFQF